jgi:hypothetical protein
VADEKQEIPKTQAVYLAVANRCASPFAAGKVHYLATLILLRVNYLITDREGYRPS